MTYLLPWRVFVGKPKCQLGRNVTSLDSYRLAGKGVHQPADRNANQEEQEKRPRGVLEALRRAPAPESAKGERNNQGEKHHGLKVSERCGHLISGLPPPGSFVSVERSQEI